MKWKIITTIVSYLSITHVVGQHSNDLPRDAKPGKCYAKCLVGDTYHEKEITVYVPLDGTSGFPGMLEQDFIIQKSEQLVDEDAVPEKVMHLLYYPDSSQCNFCYSLKIKHYEKKEAQFTPWVEVVCESNISEGLITALQKALKEKGFYAGSYTGIFDTETKKAMIAFQKSENLQIGSLSIETLRVLKIWD